MTWRIEHGDCIEVMRSLPDASVDAVVTDPPYGLAFMGKRWDYDVPSVEVWRECLRALKPGGHLLAFAGTRTQHRMCCRIEDAGFEIRDMIAWVYGSGFPKSLDVSKAIDKQERGAMVREKLMHFAKVRGVNGKWLEEHGVASASSFQDWTIGGHVPGAKNWALVKAALGVTAEEETAFERAVVARSNNGIAGGTGTHAGTKGAYGFCAGYDLTAPATEAARQWQGWGTALKPALEPITVARKPLVGTVAENVLAHGTGAINVDGCRVGGESTQRTNTAEMGYRGGNLARTSSSVARVKYQTGSSIGRWPANLIHDGSDEVVALFPETGLSAGGRIGNAGGGNVKNLPTGAFTKGDPGFGDSGSAARFFYCAKADATDRGKGNRHPTVKPTMLMRYLCRLVTPPGGTVLDPFCGSGSTGKAAIVEGFNFIGIEQDAESVAVARQRVPSDAPLFAGGGA